MRYVHALSQWQEPIVGQVPPQKEVTKIDYRSPVPRPGPYVNEFKKSTQHIASCVFFDASKFANV